MEALRALGGSEIITALGQSLAVILATALLIKLIHIAAEQYISRFTARAIVVRNRVELVKVLLYLFTGFVVIRLLLAARADAVLAVVGGGAVVAGLAARELLANIFAGVFIFFERPFSVGDRIQVGPYYGEVDNISLRATTLVTPEDSRVSVPNSMVFSEGSLSANAGDLEAMVVIEFYFAHSVSISEIRQVLWEAAVTSKYFYAKRPVEILVEETPVATAFYVRAFVADIRQEFPFAADVTARAKERLKGLDPLYPEDVWAGAPGLPFSVGSGSSRRRPQGRNRLDGQRILEP